MLIAGVSDFFQDMWYGMWLFFDKIFYSLMCYLYRIFLLLAKFNPFSIDAYQTVVKNVYVVIGVIMLFLLTYSLLKAVINPDEFAKGEANPQKLILNIVTSVIILIVLPTCFKFMGYFQSAIIDNDFLGNVILGTENDSTASTIKQGGMLMAERVYQPFFFPDSSQCGSLSNKSVTDECAKSITIDSGSTPPTLTDGTNIYVVENLSNAYSALIKTGDYSVLTYFIDSVKSGKIAYLFVISTIVGIAMCYVIFSFAIDLGIRVAKLIFLQIIAPVPVIFKAMPKGKDVFNNWVKMLAQTYANLFIRVGAMYIGVEVIVILTSSNVSLFVNSGETNRIIMLANALIVMGVIAFAKEAPKMLAKLFPFLDGQLKLGIKDKLAEGGAFALGAGAGAMVTGAVQNFAGTKGNLWHKFGNGLLGAAAGAKNGVVAGAKAKSWSDMKNATTTAGAKVAASRAARAQRNARYKESGYFATKFGDFKDAASVWATGGLNKFAAEETFIGDAGKNISTFENGIDKLYDRQSTNGKVQTAYLKQSADKALEEYSKGFTLNKAYKDAYGNEHTFETQEEYEKFRNVLEYQKENASGLSKEAMAAKIAAAQKAGYQKDATVTDMYGQETTIRDENAYYSYISDLTKQMGDIDRGSKKMLKNLSSSGNTKALETMGAYSVTGDKLIVDQAQADFQIAKDYIGEHSGMAQQLNDGQAVDIKNFDYDSLSNFKDQLSRKSNEIAVEKAKLQREQQMRDSSKPKDK